MRVVENKGITLLYISNGIHFKRSSLSASEGSHKASFFASGWASAPRGSFVCAKASPFGMPSVNPSLSATKKSTHEGALFLFLPTGAHLRRNILRALPSERR